MLPRIPTIITLVSMLPFVVLSMVIASDLVDNIDGALHLMITYAIVILSFLAGTRWGMALDHQDVHDKLASRLYLMSSTMVVISWLVLLIPNGLTQLLCLSLLFTVAWGTDSMLHDEQIIPLWFFTLRSIVTPIVIVSLYVSYFSII